MRQNRTVEIGLYKFFDIDATMLNARYCDLLCKYIQARTENKIVIFSENVQV